MAGQWIGHRCQGRRQLQGLSRGPAASGSGPGILLLQEIFGVNKSMREVADH